MQAGSLVHGSTTGRWALTASILGSGMAFLDTTIVNVALPEIGDSFDVGFSAFQWVVNAYLLTLSALLLIGGSLGDRFGRRSMFVVGVAGFGVASLGVGLAPNIEVLVAARLAQGVAAALLTPASLAMLQAAFVHADRPKAIAVWSGFSGLSTIVGPLLGGWLIDVASWRWAFLINPPIAALVVWIAVRHVPESRDPAMTGRPDLAGATAATLALAGVVYALIQGPVDGWSDPAVVAAAVAGVLAGLAFVVVERRVPRPMLPAEVLRSRQFNAANLTTLLVYFVLGGAFFLATLQVRETLGYSAFEAGLAFVPITVLLFILSPRAGRWMAARGPRLPMTVGPIVAGVGVALLWRVQDGTTYVTGPLPALLVFGVGLGLTVAPLTSTALGALDERFSGIASAINNTVARAGGLLAVPLLPLMAGMGVIGADFGSDYSSGFQRAMLIGGVICAAGGAASWLFITDPPRMAASSGERPPPST